MPEVSPGSNQPTQSQVQPGQGRGISWKKIAVTVVVIVVVTAIIAALIWFFVINKPESTSTEPIKVSTPSSKLATPSSKKATPPTQKDETAGWKVYKDEASGVSFKYPPDWVENHEGSDKVANPALANYKGPGKEGLDPGMAKIQYNRVFSYTKKGFKILKEYLDYRANLKEGDPNYSPYTLIRNIKKTKLGKVEVYLTDVFTYKTAYIDVGSGSAVSLSLIANPLGDFEEIFELALSTIKTR